MLKLYNSLVSASVVRDSSQRELDDLKKAYNLLIHYEMIEQKYSVICNNAIDLDTSVVEVHHKTMNNMSPAMFMYANCEINRRLFNALSSYYAYHEFMDELFKENIPEVSTFDFKAHFKALTKRDEVVAFGWDLRHYYNHYGFPCKSISVRMDRPYPPITTSAVVLGLSMNFDQSDLNAKFTWSPLSLALIGKQPTRFDILPLVNRYFCAWIDVHRSIRQHYASQVDWAAKVIHRLFADSGKHADHDQLCIADDADVHPIPNTSENLATFDKATVVHRQFIQRVNYYLENFQPAPCQTGRFITLAPKL